MKNTISQIARMFHCTPDQVRAQFSRNADGLSSMAEKAMRTGKKVNGYTAEQLANMAAKAKAKARSLEQ